MAHAVAASVVMLRPDAGGCRQARIEVPSPMPSILRCTALVVSLAAMAGCGKPPEKPPPAPLEVTTLSVEPRDVLVSAEYVAQTQSSQAVNIQARVSGFLDKRVYTEGAVVKAGQVLYKMDPKPFQAQVDAAAAALQRNQASLQVATANLNRTKPLAAKNALSQKDLDDATGQYEQAGAAVAQSKAQLDSANLDLSYTTITSPVAGVTSYSAVAEGSYVSPQNSQLTTVSVLSPMWVNFSLSENEVQRIQNDVAAGRLRLPPDRNMTVEIVQTDGALFPFTGKITFADPSYNAQTGTFLLRATVDNPKGALRPNQYVRARLRGAVRPNAILVPQRAVQQSGQGHFAWLVNKDGKAEMRPITVGDWYGDELVRRRGPARRRPGGDRRRAAAVGRRDGDRQVAADAVRQRRVGSIRGGAGGRARRQPLSQAACSRASSSTGRCSRPCWRSSCAWPGWCR